MTPERPNPDFMESEQVPSGMFYLTKIDGKKRYLLCEGSITQLGDAFSAWGMIMDAMGEDTQLELIFNKDDIDECSNLIFTPNQDERKRNI